MAFTSYSQITNQDKPIKDLKPLLYFNNSWNLTTPNKSDTLFCFNVAQSKYIFKNLLENQSCNVIITNQDKVINNFKKVVTVNNQIIDSLKQQIKTYEKIGSVSDSIVKTKDVIIVQKEIKITNQENKIKKINTISTVKSVVIIVLTILGFAIAIQH